MKLKRQGDVNLYPVKEVKGKLLKTDGSFVLAKGEVTGSVHLLQVENPDDLCVYEDADGTRYFRLTEPGVITHTTDHEPITLPVGTYRQVAEREVDYFEDGVVRKVID